MQTKQELRKFAKSLRKTLNVKEISAVVTETLFQLPEYINAGNIAAYYPYDSELDITPLFEDNHKNIYLPKINKKDNMVFCPYKRNDELSINKYGIAEPLSESIDTSLIEVMILPALMADKQGYRLGYGKGYYDKFLNKSKFKGVKIVLIADNLLKDILPNDKNDIPVDIIITEKRTIHVL